MIHLFLAQYRGLCFYRLVINTIVYVDTCDGIIVNIFISLLKRGRIKGKGLPMNIKPFFGESHLMEKRFGILKGQLHGSAPGHQSTTLQSESVRGNAPIGNGGSTVPTPPVEPAPPLPADPPEGTSQTAEVAVGVLNLESRF